MMRKWALFGSIVAIATAAIILAQVFSKAMAQEHRHPPQDEAIHEKFYSTWFMPDNPARSCCNKADCYPTEVKIEGEDLLIMKESDVLGVIQ